MRATNRMSPSTVWMFAAYSLWLLVSVRITRQRKIVTRQLSLGCKMLNAVLG
jgi:hypothetical protein